MSIGQASKRFQRDQARKARQQVLEDFDTFTAEHERRVKEFLTTAGERTLAGQRERQSECLSIQETDDAISKVCHATGAKKKNLAEIEGDDVD